jgi:hypothetical protein
MQVCGCNIVEEFLTKSFVSVQENSVCVVVQLCGGILYQELNLPDKSTAALLALQGCSLLGFLVISLCPLSDITWFDFLDTEGCSEGVVLALFLIVEEFSKRSVLEVSPLLVDL